MVRPAKLTRYGGRKPSACKGTAHVRLLRGDKARRAASGRCRGRRFPSHRQFPEPCAYCASRGCAAISEDPVGRPNIVETVRYDMRRITAHHLTTLCRQEKKPLVVTSEERKVDLV